MNIAIWILQAAAAFFFLMGGANKLLRPIDQLARHFPWTGQVNPRLVRSIGAIEIAGSAGLILPAVTHIAPKLTLAAAAGLTTLMICAVIFHLTRREVPFGARAAVVGLLMLLIVVGRWTVAPI